MRAVLQMWREMHAHVQRIAGSHVRNAATVGGNVILTRTRNLPSDVSTLLLAAGRCRGGREES